jgi:cobaltochelatase CobS
MIADMVDGRRSVSREAFINGDMSTVMSPRTVLTWAENTQIFGDRGHRPSA